jgi:cytochrome b561
MDMQTARSARYSRVAIALHWIIALLIVLNFIGAWSAEDLPKAEKAYAMAGHKAFGITILALSLLRLAWKLTHPAPPLLETLKSWEAALAKVTHWLFYFLMIATPLAGWGLHSAASGGKALTWFSQFDVPALPVGSDKPTVGMFHELHEVFAFTMLLLLVLHVAAALKHQFVDKDGTLRRIVPWMK